MSSIQTIGPFPNTPSSTTSTATPNEGVSRGGNTVSTAAIASPVDHLGGGKSNPAPPPDPQLQEAMTKINQSANFRVEIEAAKGMALPVITIRDRATGEIIRQMPPRLFVAAAGQIDSTHGLLFEKVA